MNNDMIKWLNENLGLHLKTKRKKKYATRKKYLIFSISLVGALLLTIIISMFSKGPKVKHFNASDPMVTQVSKMQKVSSKYNPKTGLLVSTFYISNPSKVSDVTDDKNLANIKYKINYKELRGNVNDLTTKKIKIDDHYFVLITRGVAPGFQVLRYDISPKKIDSALNTDYREQNTISFYVDEDSVKRNNSLTEMSKDMYRMDYIAFVVEKYQDAIKKDGRAIKRYKRAKEADKKLIKKLNNKLENAIKSDQDDIQSQIDDTQSDLDQQNANIKSAKKEIKILTERIDNAQQNQDADA